MQFSPTANKTISHCSQMYNLRESSQSVDKTKTCFVDVTSCRCGWKDCGRSRAMSKPITSVRWRVWRNSKWHFRCCSSRSCSSLLGCFCWLQIAWNAPFFSPTNSVHPGLIRARHADDVHSFPFYFAYFLNNFALARMCRRGKKAFVPLRTRTRSSMFVHRPTWWNSELSFCRSTVAFSWPPFSLRFIGQLELRGRQKENNRLTELNFRPFSSAKRQSRRRCCRTEIPWLPIGSSANCNQIFLTLFYPLKNVLSSLFSSSWIIWHVNWHCSSRTIHAAWLSPFSIDIYFGLGTDDV